VLSFGLLGGDRGGECVGQLMDLFEQVGEDALRLHALAGDRQLAGHGTEVVQRAADLDHRTP